MPSGCDGLAHISGLFLGASCYLIWPSSVQFLKPWILILQEPWCWSGRWSEGFGMARQAGRCQISAEKLGRTAEQLHNKWELALRPPCHQSNFFWRLFSQLASLSYRFGMIEPGHGTGCEHQPIEFRRVSQMQKAGSPEDSEDHRKKGRVKSSYHLCLQH